ncbi:16S rRNA (uracil(1498)-N(3))-methyltransferase [Flavobacterium sp. NST-5]|uniref:Ribosomal RNA small subunit methyltransferase E n=1 Tax=Flavobacterium ichthyis TaxID=2698827 RepID=A0ABW9ZAE8_9FLAO|nr:16S rRNA (uracil(1498)-N(3))-methyltransferase [Flavobacterium ichthyis]NBL65694.1 16S rRNA (uracil(1498)-N(3))-methyltransferase [Flavobacterium ichthyis]
MQLFYNQNISTETETFFFDKEESKHIIKVLRKKNGDNLLVSNGLGFLFKTEIILDSDSKCQVKIISFEKQDAPKFNLHLAVAPTKMNDRFEWFLEKVTEIGISEITPIICENSERKVIKNDRFEKIIVSAAKQSLHYFLPKLNPAVSFSEFIKKEKTGQKFIAHCEETDKKSLKETIQKNEDVVILIGPEGDFSSKEIKLAIEKNYQPVTLGNTRLRTETAAVVACHSVVFINQ